MHDELLLTNHFLIAMPELRHICFAQTVIYICEQHAHETVGLIINKPINCSIDVVFEQLGVTQENPHRAPPPLMFGGPIQPDRGFVMHPPCGQWRSSLTSANDEVTITTSNDIIRAIAHDTGPQKSLLALGYVGWSPEQLEQEIMNNVWLLCPFKAELLYEVPFADRWKEAGLLLGVHMDQVAPGAGHA